MDFVGKGVCAMDTDINGITGSVGLRELPMGFGMALAMNESAMKGYAGLTESEKEDLILRCRDAKTKEEMQRIVDSLVQDTDVSALEEIVQPKAMG